MKKKLNKSIRMSLMCLLFVLTVIFSILIFYEVTKQETKEEIVTLYSYQNSATANYKVNMTPSFVFPDTVLGEGKEYISALVDNIQATFNYQFTGDGPAKVQGTYEVVGIIEGYVERLGPDGTTVTNTIWTKDVVFIPKTNFEATDDNFSLSKDITFKPVDYDNYANAVKETTRVSTNSRFTASMKVELNADTDKGSIEESISSSITFPLNNNLFSITKGEMKKPGTIQDTKEIRLPVNKTLVTVYGILLAAALIALIYLFFATRGTVKEPFRKQLDRIFKRHGSRLVALSSEITLSDEQHRVRTIDDLVRIADDLGKPIVYKHSINPDDINRFYVMGEGSTYFFNLSDYIAALEEEKAGRGNKIKAATEVGQHAGYRESDKEDISQ
ncbi:DUF5305 family protein [Desulfofalx alkaliphila]|uniref:DUF5305 family protein n=1 Tax=Desulfofalx alkaliphila TaxID=105483 RepID=UPI0004E0D9DB|nr:DUF5305 family protein [Desulfofalx alkaliphila]